MNISDFFDENLGLVIYIISVIVGAVVLGQLLRLSIKLFLKRSSARLKSDPTNFNFLKNSVTFLVITLAVILILYRLPGGEALAVSIFASAGIIAAVVGFASQTVLSNIVSGIFIVIFKPLRVGDLIRIGTEHQGTVEDITLRHTVIRDFENRRIIIPNSVISEQTVVNLTIGDPKICRQITFRIGYDADIKMARSIIAEEATQHPLCLDNRTEEDKAADKPIVDVRVIELGESAVVLRASVWSANPGESWGLFTDLNERVKERFSAAGVHPPYPHRIVVEKQAK